MREIGDEEIEIAVLIVVAARQTHATLFATVLAVRGRRQERYVRKSALVVAVEYIRRRIIGNVNVQVAVLVPVAGQRGKTIVLVVGNAKSLTGVGKSPTRTRAVVAIELIPFARHPARAAEYVYPAPGYNSSDRLDERPGQSRCN